VTSPSGLVFPIETLVRELDRLGVDTVVDAAHAPGMVPIDLKALNAAYWTGNGHKWLCGPKTAGVLVVREERLSVVLAALSSLAFCTRRFASAFGQYVAIAALGGVLLALFGLVDSWLVVVGYKTQLVALVLFESFMAARVALRLWLLAAQVELQREPGRSAGLP